jgi:hypothetical protein
MDNANAPLAAITLQCQLVEIVAVRVCQQLQLQHTILGSL